MPLEPRDLVIRDLVDPIAEAEDEDKATMREAMGLREAALLDTEERDTATIWHVQNGTAEGFEDVGVAVDRMLHGVIEVTPDAGVIDHPYSRDPATSEELPEVAEEQANVPLNIEAQLTNANALAGENFLSYPDPGSGLLENRELQATLFNTDIRHPVTVKLAPYAAGVRRRARWASGGDVILRPGDLLRTRASWVNGELDVDKFVREAVWATPHYVAGSAGGGNGVSGGGQRDVLNVLAGDLIVGECHRIDGQGITPPAGKPYSFAIGDGSPTSPNGRFLLSNPTNRAVMPFWGFAPADGVFPTGLFSGVSGRISAIAFREVGAVVRWSARFAEASTSLEFAQLEGPLVPNALIIDMTTCTAASLAQSPAGNAVEAFFNGGGGTATSMSISYRTGVTSYAPAPATVPAAQWTSIALECSPRRIS